jgi:hypothetical protein
LSLIPSGEANIKSISCDCFIYHDTDGSKNYVKNDSQTTGSIPSKSEVR